MKLSMNSEFTTYSLNDAGIENVKRVKVLFDDFLNELVLLMGLSGREQSIVRTKLEEASFFAVKATSKLIQNRN